MAEKTTKDEETRKEVLFRLKDHLEDIRDLKRYQWQSTYYAVLAQAGLMAISHISEKPSCFYRATLILACASTVWAWIGINGAIEQSLYQTRHAAEELEQRLTITNSPTNPDRKTFYRTLRWTVIGGAFVVSVAILFG